MIATPSSVPTPRIFQVMPMVASARTPTARVIIAATISAFYSSYFFIKPVNCHLSFSLIGKQKYNYRTNHLKYSNEHKQILYSMLKL